MVKIWGRESLTRGCSERGAKESEEMGGMLIGIRKGLEIGEERVMKKGLMIEEVKWGEEVWKVGIIYVGGKVQNILERIREEMVRIEREIGWILGGDFNAKTRERKALEDKEERVVRRSKDEVINEQEKN